MENYQALNDPQTARSLLQFRLLLVFVLVLVLSFVLIGRYFFLQINKHELYATLSDENRVHVRAVPPTRGLIYDRNGVVLAENLPSYTLSIVRERAEDVDQLLVDLDRLISLDAKELERFNAQRKQYRRPYDGIALRFKLTEEEVAILAVNEFRLPGIQVDAELVRHYPFGEMFAHTLGYVGRINGLEASKLSQEHYEGTHIIGKIGVEKQYENVLLGEVGYEYVETDARGHVQRILERKDPIAGENLWLHLDSRLQESLFDALESSRASVVAIDVETGGVLAMLSTPGFDPNLFVTGISSREYNAFLHNLDKPLYDRSLLGEYPPGSTVKPLYGLAGLAAKAVTADFSIQDHGFFQLPNEERRFRDWKREGHGRVDMRKAISESCDVYFYELGHRAGIDAISQFGDMFGLGRRTGIDLPSERYGVMPSREWKRVWRGIAWYPGDTINASIGQGFTLTTPLQLANMTAMMARRGTNIPPRVLRAKAHAESLVDNPEQSTVFVPKEYWDLVFQGMHDVIHSPRGTAHRVSEGLEYSLAGKTGTAQVVGIEQGAEYDSEQLKERLRDHALFIGFAPLEKPKIAVSVILENGEASSAAAAIARVVIDKWHALNTSQKPEHNLEQDISTVEQDISRVEPGAGVSRLVTERMSDSTHLGREL